jgi:5-deoxy-glucuronate isomerase
VTLLRRARTPGEDGLVVGVTPEEAGWRYVHFAAYRLPAGARHGGDTGRCETALIVLGGECRVRAGDAAFERVGRRRDVWERVPPYVVLMPPGLTYAVEATTELHLAVAAAPADGGRPARLITPDEVVGEERGEGQTHRRVQHLLPPTADAARLILVEVYTPAGNWSSFPPHKHDTEDPPTESYLEETYYHLIDPPTGFCLQRVYTADRGLDEAMAPGDGDLVLVPRGYHPVVATPGHESYYLNVMAGPSRAWNFRVDPDYAALMNWSKPPVARV